MQLQRGQSFDTLVEGFLAPRMWGKDVDVLVELDMAVIDELSQDLAVVVIFLGEI